MHQDGKKAIYMNLFLLAASDGEIAPEERDFLRRFTDAAGIDDATAAAWQGELEAGTMHFRSIDGEEEKRQALGMMARMIRVDGEFDPKEQAAYVNMGKALGFSQEALGTALREYWDEDPTFPFSEPPQAPESTIEDGTILLVQDDIAEMKPVTDATGPLRIVSCDFDSLPEIEALTKAVLFHAAESKGESAARLEALSKRYEGFHIAFIARRDQAPQIGYLLGLGADRCFVEPLYPNEIAGALGDSI